MSDRYGSLLVFKDGVSFEEAVEALRKIKHLLDLPKKAYDYKARKEVPLRCKDVVQAFNPEHGFPTFYIP